MHEKQILLLFAGLLFCAGMVVAQVATRTGSIYGKVLDDKGAVLPGVNVTLESEVIPAQTRHQDHRRDFELDFVVCISIDLAIRITTRLKGRFKHFLENQSQ